jgi:hypothetical protein
VVCHAIGLETGMASQDYIQLHHGDSKLLMQSLNYVRLAASRILTGTMEESDTPEARVAWGQQT